jgi:hypothetical protein
MWVSDQSVEPRLRMNPPRFAVEEWTAARGEPNWLAVSEPLVLSDSRVEFILASADPDVRFGQFLLFASPDEETDNRILTTLLQPPPARVQDVGRNSPTSYAGLVSGAAGGVLVFTEAYHKGWQARVDGEQLPHIRVLGNLNGYWVRPGEAANSEIRLTFAPQRAYRMGLAVSALSFVLVTIALTAPVVWRAMAGRARHDSPAGGRWREAAARFAFRRKTAEPLPRPERL